MANSLIVCLLLIFAAHQLNSLVQNGYHISPYTSNWFEAVEYCHRFGMRLAVVNTPEKHAAVVKEAQDTGLWTSGFMGVWLGASDLARTRTYIWQDTGARVNFARWNAGEPSGGNEHCMNLYYWVTQRFNWTWNDAPCDTSLYAICEPRNQC
ncbi:C-type lectin mannose-binding isoform-like [Topomyia yanbarensis]|uniref:C-type lectin mannose-binding isoform-like n=1 Tax=Topomyia yanbarensis TaxID=2498891 RepID=UPI00273BDD85|nr:C-type lectin mannose-binding isoform-like [Topomyia yanbarensis]